MFGGFYPRIVDQRLEPRQALRDHFETCVERDVRRMGGVANLSAFAQFAGLCAGWVGQLLSLTSLSDDVGVSRTTIRQWLTLLERSYIVFLLPPFAANIRKRLVKSPKLHFHDVGLASYLLGIEDPGQVATHPLRGALFVARAVPNVVARTLVYAEAETQTRGASDVVPLGQFAETLQRFDADSSIPSA